MKRKLDTRFPAARIKKIMQSDEDVGKIAMAVPLLVSKALELFLQDLCDRTYEITLGRGAKTLSSLHLKQCVQSFNVFDFLKEVVHKVPDLGGASAGGDDRSVAKRRKVDNEDHYGEEASSGRRIMHDAVNMSSSSRGCGRGRGRGRGRPRANEGRASAQYDKYEDDPDLYDKIQELKPAGVMSVIGKDNAELMDPEKKMETSIRKFDLNIGLDENGDSTAMSAAAPVSANMLSAEVMREEYPGWTLAEMDDMAVDPVQLASLHQRMEEDDDYDDEG